MAMQFKATLWPTLATVAGVALTVALGCWQLARAHTKEALRDGIAAASRDARIELPAALISADDFLNRRIEVRGRFEPRYGILIDNRVLNGAVGYYVVMPLAIGNGDRYVLVNRGWIAGTNARDRLPEVATPAGVVTVSGRATVPAKRYFELSSNVAEGKVWQNLVLDRYRAAVPIALQPIVIQQENEAGDGLTREWPAPDFGIDMHYGYAFQWFALAITLAIFYVATHVKKQPL